MSTSAKQSRTDESLPDATFGAAAMAPATAQLPGVYPREMGPNTMMYLQEVVDSGLASNMVDRFTSYLAEMHGMKFAIGTTGCTQAIFAAMMALDFEPGDEIIASPISDYGSIAGAVFQNYIPVFADTLPGTALIDVASIEKKITDRTRAIIAVHKLGLPCDMDAIMELAARHDLVVIEDVCQAILSTYKGRLAGTMGHLSCFSFDSEKTCGGDIGGAVLTNDEALFHKLQNRGIARGAVQRPGFGREYTSRGFAVQIPQCSAATTLANLEILAPQVEARQKSARMLDERVAQIAGLSPYVVPDERTHSYWMYGFVFDPDAFTCSADDFAAQVAAGGIEGVGLGRYYLMPAGVPFLDDMSQAQKFPYCKPPASYDYVYSGDGVPHAQAFLDRWIRWFWTEKYTEQHVELMAAIILDVAERNRR
jgi:dTDP-4-amino-4,6-dideoxygalactose transaminase